MKDRERSIQEYSFLTREFELIRFQRDVHSLVVQKFGLYKCVHDYQTENLAKTKFV